jgi:SSS family solute:Na+ symporter
MIIAGLVAPSLRTLDQAYQFIQEYVGFISPGVLAIFLLGLFWRRTTSAAALAGTLLTIPVSTILKFLPRWTNGAFPDFPFLDRMSITFVLILAVMIIMSLSARPDINRQPAIDVNLQYFRLSPAFLVGSVLATFW